MTKLFKIKKILSVITAIILTASLNIEVFASSFNGSLSFDQKTISIQNLEIDGSYVKLEDIFKKMSYATSVSSTEFKATSGANTLVFTEKGVTYNNNFTPMNIQTSTWYASLSDLNKIGVSLKSQANNQTQAQPQTQIQQYNTSHLNVTNRNYNVLVNPSDYGYTNPPIMNYANTQESSPSHLVIQPEYIIPQPVIPQELPIVQPTPPAVEQNNTINTPVIQQKQIQQPQSQPAPQTATAESLNLKSIKVKDLSQKSVKSAYTAYYDNLIYKNENLIADISYQNQEQAKKDLENAKAKKIEIQTMPDNSFNGIVYNVPLYRQNSTPLCWAYSQVMIENAKNTSNPLTQEQARQRAESLAGNPAYWDEGGFPSGARRLGKPTDIQKIIEQLKSEGPLYADYNGNMGLLSSGTSGHMLVVTGAITAKNLPDLVYINNPWGSKDFQTFGEFMRNPLGADYHADAPLKGIYDPDIFE